MCTMIGTKLGISGSAKSALGWVKVNEATIGYDHATRAWAEHALRMDFLDTTAPNAGHVAIEIDLASGRALLERLQEVIAAAEQSGVE